MEFNIQKYLVENNLTDLSRVRKENTDEDDFDVEEPTDDWHKAEPDHSAQFEKEPTAKDLPQQEPAALSGIHKKQDQLQQLISQKDLLLMQYKSGQLSIDQYKKAIGNIPQHIKRLKDQIEKAMNVSIDDEQDELA